MSFKKLNLKKIMIMLIIILLAFFSYQKWTTSLQIKKSFKTSDINIDLLGTGTPQQVYVSYLDDKTIIEVKEKNKTITQSEFANKEIKKPTKLSAIKFKDSETKEYLHWHQFAGPHQFESVFFTIYDKQLVMLMAADLESESWYMPFWTSRGKNILIKDIDQDGFKEIVEFVDEFPVDAPRLEDLEIKKIFQEEFAKQGLDQKGMDESWQIINRENNGLGRGFRVVWNIYSFVDVKKPYFKKLNIKEYDAMVEILLKDSPAFLGTATFSMNPEDGLYTFDPEISLADTISRRQISRDAIEFNNLVRKFWAGGYYQKPFGEQMPEITAKQTAELMVRRLPEVQEWLSLFSKIDGKSSLGGIAIVEFDHMKDSEYVIHVYKVLSDHIATFNWYDVNLETKETKAEF